MYAIFTGPSNNAVETINELIVIAKLIELCKTVPNLPTILCIATNNNIAREILETFKELTTYIELLTDSEIDGCCLIASRY